MRRIPLAAVMVIAGCGLPPRDNPYDPASAARLSLSVESARTPALSATRTAELEIVVDAFRPNGAPVVVELTQTGCDGETHLVGTATVTLGTGGTFVPARAAWTPVGPFCFLERGGGEFRQLVEIRGQVVDSPVMAVAPFELVDQIPVADPGPMLWVDPSWGTLITFDNARNRDADGDPLVPDDVLARLLPDLSHRIRRRRHGDVDLSGRLRAPPIRSRRKRAPDRRVPFQRQLRHPPLT